MARKPDLYERVDDAIAEGKLWRAKEMLQGNIGTRGYDTKLFDRYGQVLLAMGDLVEAGRYLFLSGERKPDYEEAIGLYLARHTRKDPRNLLGTFPQPARLQKLDAYPEAVRRALEDLGIKDKVLALAPYCTRSEVGNRGCYVGCIAIAVLAAACLCVGFYVIAKWIVGYFAS